MIDKRDVRSLDKDDFFIQLTDGTNEVGVTAGSEAQVLETNSADIKTALEIIDDWDEADRAKVNPVVGQAGVQGGAGTVTASTQRVAFATDANAVDTGLTQPLTDAQLRASAVPVTLDDITGDPKAKFVESASLAAAASSTLSGDALGSEKRGSLEQVTVSSEVPFKAVIQKVDETPTTTTIATIYGEAGKTEQFKVFNKQAALFQVDSDATPTAKYQVVVTNNNDTGILVSGVIHVTIEWDEADIPA